MAFENLPFFKRMVQIVRRRVLTFLRYPVPSRFVAYTSYSLQHELRSSYLLVEYIEKSHGTLHSETWNGRKNIPELRTNLSRSLSQIILAFGKVPLPRIGSFMIDDNGFLHLQNRPLASEIQELENEGIPIDMPRNFTYITTDSYVIDMLSCHESRLQHQPNAITNEADCISQMAALTLMKALFPQFFQRDLRRGPFIFYLSDLQENNIIVDANWNITYLIDLEWGLSRPIEMLDISMFWNSTPDGLAVDEKLRQEFVDIQTLL